MDYLLLSFTNFWYVWLIIIILLLIKLSKPYLKGKFGETQIGLYLSRLNKKQYIVLNNVMLSNNNYTTQIDHIVVSVYGIFVIETKNYNGWIFGNDYDEYWSQSIFKKKSKFKNPIKQNYGHMKAVEKLINNSQIPIFSIVAFSSNATLKNRNYNSTVCYFSKINKAIYQHNSIVMNFSQAEKIADILLNNNVNSFSNRQKHNANIKDNIKQTNHKISNNICPKCGSQLVQRKGKYGYFTGCSNFPKCRFTLK